MTTLHRSSHAIFSLLTTPSFSKEFSDVTLVFTDGSVNYYRSLLYLFSPWWKELLLPVPSCNKVLLPHTSRGQFMQELEQGMGQEQELMQELELGQELGLSMNLQEKEGSKELSEVDPLNSLDNYRKHSKEVEDMFESQSKAEDNFKWPDIGSNNVHDKEKDNNKRSQRHLGKILEEFSWPEEQEDTDTDTDDDMEIDSDVAGGVGEWVSEGTREEGDGARQDVKGPKPITKFSFLLPKKEQPKTLLNYSKKNKSSRQIISK